MGGYSQRQRACISDFSIHAIDFFNFIAPWVSFFINRRYSKGFYAAIESLFYGQFAKIWGGLWNLAQ